MFLLKVFFNGGNVMEEKDSAMIQEMFGTIISAMQGMEKRLNTQMENLEKRLTNRIDQLDSKLDDTNKEVHKINMKIENNIEKRLDSLYDGYKQLYEKVDVLESEFQTVKDNTDILNALAQYHK